MARLAVKCSEARRPPEAGDDDAVDLNAGHAFGRVDRLADGAFGLVHVDDEPVLDAQRPLVADAEHADAMRAPVVRRALARGRERAR